MVPYPLCFLKLHLIRCTCLESLGVLLLERGAVEELVGRLGVGEVVADPANALVTAAAEAQPGDGLALK